MRRLLAAQKDHWYPGPYYYDVGTFAIRRSRALRGRRDSRFTLKARAGLDGQLENGETGFQVGPQFLLGGKDFPPERGRQPLEQLRIKHGIIADG